MIIYSKSLMKGITMEPTHKVAVVTGGAQGIGKAIVDAFRSQGVVVYVIDKQPGDWFVGDVSDKSTLEEFASFVK
jgi:NAD(P)-dependent dehydrogenase (short-subunit alcohol dehydrogenase family)